MEKIERISFHICAKEEGFLEGEKNENAQDYVWRKKTKEDVRGM